MNQKISKENYRNSELIFCSFVPVGLEDYASYFIKNFNNFIYLRWKFPHGKGNIQSLLVEYFDGKKIGENKILTLPSWNNKFFYFLFLPVNYSVYFFQSIFYLWRRKRKKNRIFFGINYFCAFCGIILKKFGRVDFVIYRVMDFFPLPPKGFYRILNRIFYTVDNFCLKNADSIWFTTEGHIIGREKYGYFDRKNNDYQIIPLAVDIDKFVSKDISETNNHSLVYCGVISRYHMMDLLFDVMVELKKYFNDIKLNLIGSGPDTDYFKNLAQKKELKGNIIFHGFMEEDQKFRDLMADNALGIAFYKDEENFMKYTEPAKVKYYLNFGVPAIISDVPVIAKELNEKRICLATKNEKEEIIDKIKTFLSDSALQVEYKKNISNFVKTIDVNSLLDNSLKNTFRE
jgi:glycosyltransferase involved in cell wall biosynthesis